jgi:hypothetical protein
MHIDSVNPIPQFSAIGNWGVGKMKKAKNLLLAFVKFMWGGLLNISTATAKPLSSTAPGSAYLNQLFLFERY